MKQELEPALSLSGQPVKRGTMAHEHDVHAILADIAAQQRDLAGLEKFAPIAEELAQRDEHRLYLAVARRAQGVARRQAGEHNQSERYLTQALDDFEALGAAWQVGRTLAEMGELSLARSDNEAARGYFDRARQAFETLGAVPDSERVREALEALH